ncbi:MAG: hypothetical protein DLM59_19895 [Pseudonocardiales bacterium]|nr:MAG: hypothetical protein DLM59_19895 [Pseudonocardiales bacterium]
MSYPPYDPNQPPGDPGYGYGYGQPGYGAPRPVINNYLVPAILTTIFCCLPFGIAAIVNASKVDALVNSGDYQGAQLAANRAKTWSIWSAASIGIIFALYIVGIVIAAVVGVATTPSNP